MEYCFDDFELTVGQLLISGSIMLHQKSCTPSESNVGNLYSHPAAMAGGYIIYNSVCPKNWSLPSWDEDNGIKNLIFMYYNVPNTNYMSESLLVSRKELPLSLIWHGNISSINNGNDAVRKLSGSLWTRTPYESYFTAYSFTRNESRGVNSYGYAGNALRCVAEKVFRKHPTRFLHIVTTRKDYKEPLPMNLHRLSKICYNISHILRYVH